MFSTDYFTFLSDFEALHRKIRSLLFLVSLILAGTSATVSQSAEWKTVRSSQQPIAISYHEAQINRSLARRLRVKRSIGNRPLRQEEVALVVQARTAILRQVLQWSETAYAKEVHELGFSRPAGIWREYDGKQYLHLFLYDFGDEHGGITFGSVSRVNSALKLNIRAFWRQVPNPAGRPHRALRGTIAHELFHAIQNQYAVNFSRWAKESTAEWCVEQVFPDQNHFVSRQSVFLRHPQHSLHQVFHSTDSATANDGHDHHRYASNLGRPYGASAFWMFLSQHHGRTNADWMRSLWEQASTTDDAYEALAKVLGDNEPLGDTFREYFSRYAVGSLLHDVAPPSYRLHEVEMLVETEGSQRIKVRPPTTNLDDAWNRYFTHSLTSPETAVMKVRWQTNAPSIDSQPGPQFVTNMPMGIAGTAYRVFRIPGRMTSQAGLPMLLEIDGPKNEISICAVTRYDRKWHVIPSTFNSPQRRHRVIVPAAKLEGDFIYFVVCRFGRDLAAKHYELCFSTIQPPSVKRITLHQNQRQLFAAEWKEQSSSSGGPTSIAVQQTEFTKPDTKGPSVDVCVEFSHDVRRSERPTCYWNTRELALQPAESDRIWRATISAMELVGTSQKDYVLRLDAELKLSNSDAHIPLDEDPRTVPTLAADRQAWEHYERSDRGMTIRLKAPRSYVANMRANSLVGLQKQGPVWVDLTLAAGDFGTIEEPYVVEVKLGPYRQFLYPTNVAGYNTSGHPLLSLNSFKLPERLADPLPDKLSATFLTQSGDRIEKDFTLAFQTPSVSHFGNSANEISSELTLWRERLKRSLDTDQRVEQQFSACVREGSSIIAYTDSYTEAEKIWHSTLEAYAAVKHEGKADLAWVERKFSEAEQAMMGTTYRFERTDQLIELLAARTDRGEAIVTDYIGVIDACVRFKNDTAMAHQLWETMQQLPQTQREPPVRATMHENWRFTYNRMSDYSGALDLPKEPISP